MSEIRFNRWSHQSGTGGIYQDSSGNIGIGTSVPTSVLDIQGGSIKIGNDLLTSSGVSTFTSGLNVTGGSVGIGTDNPTKPLDIRTDSGVLIRGRTGSIDAYLTFQPTTGGRALTLRTVSASFELYDTSAASSRMYWNYDGRTGINTNNPGTELHVQGTDGYAELRLSGNSGSGGSLEYFDSTTKLADIYADPSSNIVFRNTASNTERLRISSNGNVGIGTDNPAAMVEIKKTTDNTQLRVTSGYEAALWLVNGGGSEVNVINSGGSGNLSFRVSNSEKVRMTSGGNLQIANGNLVFSTSGTGIDFSATSDGSGTASSELLDDYEEGTCTLYLATSSKTSQISSSAGTGITYTKIGRKIHIYGYIVFNNIQSTLGSNYVHLWGFPYNFSSLGNSVDNGIWMWTNGTAPTNYWNGRFPGISQIINSDGGGLYSHGYNGYSDLRGTDFGNSGLHFNFDYTYQI